MVTWHYNKPTNETRVGLFETKVGVRLPEAYRTFLVEHNGGKPKGVHAHFKLADGRPVALGTMFSLDSEDPGRDLDWHFETFAGAGYLPIGGDAGGNLICMSVRQANVGQLRFWEHEDDRFVRMQHGEFATLLKHLEIVEIFVSISSTELLISAGTVEDVRRALASGLDPNITIGIDRLVQFSIRQKRQDVLELLLKSGAQISGCLHTCAEINSVQGAEAIIHHATVDLEERYGHRGGTPFHTAVFYNATEMVEWLIAKGANIHALDRFGYSALGRIVSPRSESLKARLVALGCRAVLG